MVKAQNKDTRYFVEIDLKSLKAIKCGFDQKQNLDSGRQVNPNLHRLFITKGQYSKFITRCKNDLEDILES